MSNKGRRNEAERIGPRRWTEVTPPVERPPVAAARRSATGAEANAATTEADSDSDSDSATYVSSFRISVQVVS